MEKKEEGKITIILNLIEHEETENSFLPAFLLQDWCGVYARKKTLGKIQKALDVGDRGEIFNALYFLDSHKANAYELAKIIKRSQPLIHKYLRELEKLGLIKLKKGKSKKRKPELTATIDERVTLLPYSKFIKSKDFQKAIQDEEYYARKSEEKYQNKIRTSTKK